MCYRTGGLNTRSLSFVAANFKQTLNANYDTLHPPSPQSNTSWHSWDNSKVCPTADEDDAFVDVDTSESEVDPEERATTDPNFAAETMLGYMLDLC